jgi:hypothetical protein
VTTTTDEGPPSGDGAGLPVTDRGLLEAMVTAQVAANRARAARLEALANFHARRVAERESPDRTGSGRQGWFSLTALQKTKAEVAPLLGVGEQSLEIDLDTHSRLACWLPRLWARCRSGRLDLGKALVCLDQLAHLATDTDTDRHAYAQAIQDWFDRHDPLPDPADPDAEETGLCPINRDRIARAARYQRLKHPRRSDAETFAEAFKKRRVTLRVDEETGMAHLGVTTAAHDALTADHRLTLVAKKRAQAPGETRTLAQLRVDALLDLIHGHLVVPATTGYLHHHEPCDTTCWVNGDTDDEGGGTDGDEPVPRPCPLHPLVLTTDDGQPIGGYARPVVNVTVPVTTLGGLDDTPGVLSGGLALPADYLRHLATRPGTTWYRLLTDPAGRFLALSTHSYHPTETIARTVTCRDHTCIWPGCRRPSVTCHLNHRVPHPEGPTCTGNLAPLCQRHHQVKHADGYDVIRNSDGSHTWTTRHGSTFTTPASEQPLPSRVTLTSPLETAFARLVAAET